jgi:hypothetical protein
MLDGVEGRRFLEQPARKGALEAPLRVADVELDEGSGQRLDLPGRAGFAGSEADDDIAGADRLSGLERQLARDAVALVEQADHRRAFRHRGRSGRYRRDRLRHVDRLGLGIGRAIALPLRRPRRIPVAAGEAG